MAARGARSRHNVEKQIEKETSKSSARAFAERFTATPTPSLGWSGGSSSHGGSGGARSMSSAGGHVAGGARKPSLMSSAASIMSSGSKKSDTSTPVSHASSKLAGKLGAHHPADKYVGQKGKTTKAPRGRGGGVPVTIEESNHAKDRHSVRSVKARRSMVTTPRPFRPESRQSEHGEQGRSFEQSWERTRVWIGGGVTPKPFKGFEHVSFNFAIGPPRSMR